ncbi:MAG TPA: hypothetical protein VK449_00905, partial [Anaerolineales bacterium]|nr:hypothetical protein [Anaerolineales bacterium]
MRSSRSRAWIDGGLIAAASALFLFPLALHLDGFPFSPGAAYSDALIAHLSAASFLHRALIVQGQIPLWNPTILGGMPFAADPLSGLWYPPMWFLAMAPSAPAINLLFWGHLVFGGIGMYLLLRAEGLGRMASLAGGLAFAGMPKIIGHVGLGHLTLVEAVSWSPWLLLAAGRAIEGVGRSHSARAFLVAGALAGAAFLADPRWFVPVALTALGYGTWRWVV